MPHILRKIAVFLVGCIVVQWALADDKYQNIDALKQSVRVFLIAELGQQPLGKPMVEIGYLDARLQLPACPTEKLSLTLPPGNTALNTSSVSVRCNTANNWSLYVPVKIKVAADVMVAARSLAKGESIGMMDLKRTSLDVAQLRQGFFQSPEDMINKVLKAPIQVGMPISPDHLMMPQVIARGDFVQVVAQTGKINVSVTGVAMSAGAMGDLIKIQNIKSKRIIDAKVIGPKQVEVPLNAANL